MDILVCLIDEQLYGFGLDKINSVVLAAETTLLPNAPDFFFGAINVHDEITPVINMRKLLKLPTRELELKDQFILCNVHRKQLALWIDSVKCIKNYKEEAFIPAQQFLPDLIGLKYILKEEEQMIFIYDLEKLIPFSSVTLSSA